MKVKNEGRDDIFFIVSEVCSPECLNGGSCENGKCKCPSGWEGDRCQNSK